MSRVIIWPDIYKEQGHWLPCINLAKSLKDAGYATVEFMGIPDTQPIVQPYGFPFNTILSTSAGSRRTCSRSCAARSTACSSHRRRRST
jgi:hypothetical protein